MYICICIYGVYTVYIYMYIYRFESSFLRLCCYRSKIYWFIYRPIWFRPESSRIVLSGTEGSVIAITVCKAYST